jgi:AhpD family alkylhydroperoxidase
MPEPVYPAVTADIAARRKELAPHTHEAFEAFSRAVFADGALPEVTKQLIAVAVAHTTQCPYCIRGHTRLAHRRGATDEQIMEAIWVAAEMRAGGAYAHATLALSELRPRDRQPEASSADEESTPGEESTMSTEEPVLDVRTEEPGRRHELIFETFDDLPAGRSYVLVNDHDPRPLRYQLEAENAGEFSWQYLEQGPEVWRVRIGRTASPGSATIAAPGHPL